MKAKRNSTPRGSGQTSSKTSRASLEEIVAKTQKYEKKGKRWKELTDVVTYCIAKDSLPLYSVEKPGFKKLLSTFDGIRYELPSRSYFSRTALPALYLTTKERVIQEIESVKYFSATTDLWSSIGMKPYMSYTTHFINDEWKLASRCLQTHFYQKTIQLKTSLNKQC